MKFKELIKSILGMMIWMKIYISRVISWLSIGNSLMLVFLVIDRLIDMGVLKGDLTYSFLVVVCIWFVVLVVLGWVEAKKLKAPHMESVRLLEFNLPLKEVLDRVRNIDKRTKDLEDKINNQEIYGRFVGEKSERVTRERHNVHKHSSPDFYSKDICKCGHHTKDHSYNTQPEDGNLYCDICECENFIKLKASADTNVGILDEGEGGKNEL